MQEVHYCDASLFLGLMQQIQKFLKVVSATFLLVCFLDPTKSTCQTRKNVLESQLLLENEIFEASYLY